MKEKEKRQDLILDYLRTKKGECSQKDIKNMLEEKGICVDQTTVSRDLDELDYEKGPDGHYIVKIPTAIKRNKEVLKNLFANNPPSFAGPYHMPQISLKKDISTMNESSTQSKKIKDKGIRVFIVGVADGFEAIISKLVYNIYEDIIFGAIPGNGCILVLARDSKSYNKIRRELRDLRPSGKKSKSSVLVASALPEDISEDSE